MGISTTHGQLQFFNDVCRQEQIVLAGLRMAELGNQQLRAAILGNEFPTKRLFKALGAHHVSFDINGQDGALPLDLSQPLPTKYHAAFDLVTNFGTSEHIEASQYWCWRNVHDLCRPNGWMMHTIPEIGSWPRHGKWHYAMDRCLRLARNCFYDVPINRRHEYTHHDGRRQDSLMLCFRKCLRVGFPTETTFQNIMFPEGEPHY